jgi:hypothetical protein
LADCVNLKGKVIDMDNEIAKTVALSELSRL